MVIGRGVLGFFSRWRGRFECSRLRESGVLRLLRCLDGPIGYAYEVIFLPKLGIYRELNIAFINSPSYLSPPDT